MKLNSGGLVAKMLEVSRRRSGFPTDLAWGNAVCDRAGESRRDVSTYRNWIKARGGPPAEVVLAAADILEAESGGRAMTVDELRALAARELGERRESWIAVLDKRMVDMDAKLVDHEHRLQHLSDRVTEIADDQEQIVRRVSRQGHNLKAVSRGAAELKEAVLRLQRQGRLRRGTTPAREASASE